MWSKAATLVLLPGVLSAALSGAARADGPLSAIDWLSQSLSEPQAVALPKSAVGGVIATPDVTVQSLGLPVPDAIGILSTKVTGLPRNLWGDAPAAEIERLIIDASPDNLPALQGLLTTLLLAEADAPVDSGPAPQVLLTRIDKLLALGALDQAHALIEAAGPASSPDMFRRAFDTALLVGEENRSCAVLAASPGLSPSLPTRIFCLARAGDWDAAALTLGTATALGQVDAEQSDLLTRFLDPEAAEQGKAPAPPVPVTPLDMKILASIGEPVPTATLPIAFSHADLSPDQGWKARIEAAERLARAGVITPNLLLGIYTEQKPPASGAPWDRTAAFQKLMRRSRRAMAPPPRWPCLPLGPRCKQWNWKCRWPNCSRQNWRNCPLRVKRGRSRPRSRCCPRPTNRSLRPARRRPRARRSCSASRAANWTRSPRRMRWAGRFLRPSSRRPCPMTSCPCSPAGRSVRLC